MLPTKWKAFQIICIFQALAAVLHSVYCFAMILITSRFIYYGLQIIAFLCILAFANLGSTILNSNYPDSPVIDRRKRNFNILYLVNILMPSFLAAHLYNEFTGTLWYFQIGLDVWNLILLTLPSIFYFSMLVIQFILLVGMFKLRREIFQRFYSNVNRIGSE